MYLKGCLFLKDKHLKIIAKSQEKGSTLSVAKTKRLLNQGEKCEPTAVLVSFLMRLWKRFLLEREDIISFVHFILLKKNHIILLYYLSIIY